jgi:hypothetical protein
MTWWEQLYDPDLISDISPGIVLHLDPDRLEAEGGTYSCAYSERVQGQHFFVCIETTVSKTRWLPLYTNDGPGRVRISNQGSTGHPKWTAGIHFYHPNQVWTATKESVANAAARAHDKTRRGSRNRVAAGHIPEL